MLPKSAGHSVMKRAGYPAKRIVTTHGERTAAGVSLVVRALFAVSRPETRSNAGVVGAFDGRRQHRRRSFPSGQDLCPSLPSHRMLRKRARGGVSSQFV